MVTRRLGKTNERRQKVLEARRKELTTEFLNKRILARIAAGELTKADALKQRKARIEKEIVLLEERIKAGVH
jgi:hypothetical protein